MNNHTIDFKNNKVICQNRTLDKNDDSFSLIINYQITNHSQYKKLKQSEEDIIIYFHSKCCYLCLKLSPHIEKSKKKVFYVNVKELNPENIETYPSMLYNNKLYIGYEQSKKILYY